MYMLSTNVTLIKSKIFGKKETLTLLHMSHLLSNYLGQGIYGYLK